MLRSHTVTLCTWLPHGTWDFILRSSHLCTVSTFICWTISPARSYTVSPSLECWDNTLLDQASELTMNMCAVSLGPEANSLKRALFTQWAWNSAGPQTWDSHRESRARSQGSPKWGRGGVYKEHRESCISGKLVRMCNRPPMDPGEKAYTWMEKEGGHAQSSKTSAS